MGTGTGLTIMLARSLRFAGFDYGAACLLYGPAAGGLAAIPFHLIGGKVTAGT